MEESNVGTNSLKAWLLASRPKTLAGAAVPVMIGLAMAFADGATGASGIVPAALCVLFALTMQIDANFINDYFDFKRGNDDETRLGPKRACAMGWVTPGAMQRAIALTTILACCAGLPLVLVGGMWLVLVGVLCVAFCFLYTTHLSYVGMGDVLVLVFFGIVPVTMTYYLQAHTVSCAAVWASVACGLVIDTLLIINNYRDIDNDRRAGKNTLIVYVGESNGRRLYMAAGIAALLAGIPAFALDGKPLAAALPCLYLLPSILTYRKMRRIGKGAGLNAILGETARNILLYGLLVAAGLVAGRL